MAQQKMLPPHKQLAGLLTNKAMSEHQALVVTGENRDVSFKTVTFAPANFFDYKQQWVKVYLGKDNTAAFMLVNGDNINILNGMTVNAIQRPLRPNMPVVVVNIKFDQKMLDQTLLWTEQELENGFTIIREFQNENKVLHVKHDKCVGVPQPYVTTVECDGSDKQLWKFMIPPFK